MSGSKDRSNSRLGRIFCDWRGLDHEIATQSPQIRESPRMNSVLRSPILSVG
jgi:hypothetical protein